MKKNVYAVILIAVILGSLLQLGLLAKGLSPLVEITRVLANEQDFPTSSEPLKVVGYTPSRITIDKIGLDLPITSVPLEHGTWKVNSDVANYAEGTSLVNEKDGNVGIFAHDKEKGFTKIKHLTNGDAIVVSGDGFVATYSVSKLTIAKPIEVDVYYATSKPQLTLVTCDGLFSEKRFVLTADLVSVNKL